MMSSRCRSVRSATSMLGIGLLPKGPVPQLLSGPDVDAFLVGRVHGDVPQACVDQPLPQDIRVRDLELEHRLVLRGSFEVGHHRLACAALMKTCSASNSLGSP